MATRSCGLRHGGSGRSDYGGDQDERGGNNLEAVHPRTVATARCAEHIPDCKALRR